MTAAAGKSRRNRYTVSVLFGVAGLFGGFDRGAVPHVLYRKDRVREHKARAFLTHDAAGERLLFGAVAVDFALGADGFALPVGAAGEALQSILEKGGTLGTESVSVTVVTPAVGSRHVFERFLFFLETRNRFEFLKTVRGSGGR